MFHAAAGPDFDWCPVPAGSFLMGAEDGDADERPAHQLFLDAFDISRTEVTNAQYQRFVEASGYLDERWWSADGWAWRLEGSITVPLFWGEADWSEAEQPVTGVSWYEAAAFCRWAAAVCGQPISLPSEAQWEKAARGVEGRAYPWGDDWDPSLCNSYELGHYLTLPVGSFSPEGDSHYGCADMSGNVWEWCASLYRSYPYLADDGRESLDDSQEGRIIRGGSFVHDWAVARACFRVNLHPSSRDMGFGFRAARQASRSSGESPAVL